MRITRSAFVLAIGMVVGSGLFRAAAADDDGLALAIVYDTSGSMREMVPNSSGSTSPKYVIANRALIAIVKQIQAFATNGAPDAPRKIEAGLFIFDAARAKPVVKFGKFDPDAMQKFAEGFTSPSGGTPLGNSLRIAAQAVLDSPLSRKHVLIITDGNNTLGPEPSQIMPILNRKNVAAHFIAFDVDAKVFDPVKKQGATVAGASDETQLNAQLDFILQNQILLEKPSKTK